MGRLVGPGSYGKETIGFGNIEAAVEAHEHRGTVKPTDTSEVVPPPFVPTFPQNYQEFIQDQILFADEVIGPKDYFEFPVDTIVFGDSNVALFSCVEAPHDTIVLGDSLATGYSTSETISDTYHFVDAILFGYAESVFNTIVVVDSLSTVFSAVEARSDIVSFNDSTAHIFSAVEARSDIVSFTDSVVDSYHPIIIESRQDTFVFSDSVVDTYHPVTVESRLDTFHMVDSVADVYKPVTQDDRLDTITYLDSVAVSLIAVEARQDSFSIVDSVQDTYHPFVSEARQDIFTFSDSVSHVYHAVEARQDAVAFTDSVATISASIEARQDVFHFTDSIQTLVQSIEHLSNSIAYADSVSDVFIAAGGGGGIDMSFLPAINKTTWNPGLNAVGGIPVRNVIFTTINPSGGNDYTAIQNACNACPLGQVVKLGIGTFNVNGGNPILIPKGITLRGSGPTVTFLVRTDGATADSGNPGATPAPLIIVGATRWGGGDIAATYDLTADGLKGASSVTLPNVVGLAAGMVVLLDERSGAAYQPDIQQHGGANAKVLASPDYRVSWQLHNPAFQFVDDPITFNPVTGVVGNGADAASWFCRQDRPTAEVKRIASIVGNVVTFETPITFDYRTAHTAQIARYANTRVERAGVEDLAVRGGDDGQIRFEGAAECWARNVDNSLWLGEGFAINNSYRVEIRGCYIHDAAWPQPGGGGYAISYAFAASEFLVEDCIIVKANKMMVARCSGAAGVVAYNYADDGFINTNGFWQEIGINASHMVGSHHTLFEGNWCFNGDSDDTHGNSVAHTYFRNNFTGVRKSFVNPHDGVTYNDAVLANGDGPLRCAGLMCYSYWFAFVGNVLGRAGQMAGWIYERTFGGVNNQAGIWMLGWDGFAPNPVDPNVATTLFRDGNYDFVNNHQTWRGAPYALPSSLYVTVKPSFFNNGAGYVWPPFDPSNGTTNTIPAKARFDAGTPFTQP